MSNTQVPFWASAGRAMYSRHVCSAKFVLYTVDTDDGELFGLGEKQGQSFNLLKGMWIDMPPVEHVLVHNT